MKIEKTNQIQKNNIKQQSIQSQQQEVQTDSIFDETEKIEYESKDKKTFSQVAKETYSTLNETFNKVGEKLNKDINELSKDLKIEEIIHELELDKGVEPEGIDGGFIICTGYTNEIKKVNPEKQTETKSLLKIKSGKPINVLPKETLHDNNIKDILFFETSKIDIEQKYTYRNSNEFSNNFSLGFRKEQDNNEIVTSDKIGVGISSSQLLWQNEEETSKISTYNSFSSDLVYSDKFSTYGNFITNELSLNNGFKSSLTYTINPQIEMKFSENGSYTISTKRDSYSFGSGIGVVIQPIPEEKEFKLHFNTNYSQSDYVNSENSDNLSQKIGLNTKIDFNKNFGLETGYDIHLDKNKQNSLSFGVIIR